MKWIILAPLFLSLTACGTCCIRRDTTNYHYDSCESDQLADTAVYYDPVTPISDEPTAVSATRADFY